VPIQQGYGSRHSTSGVPQCRWASKLIWLALRNITADWSRAAKEWKLAMNQFAILFEERFTQVAHGAGR
jgi:transposase-like protein